MFIKLILATKTNQQILVNLDNVETFIPEEEKTIVCFCGNENAWIRVRETLEEIEKKILAAKSKTNTAETTEEY